MSTKPKEKSSSSKQSALDKLLERTLSNGVAKKESRGKRKAKKQHAARIKADRESADPEKAKKDALKARKKNLAALEAAENADALKAQILKELGKKATYVKRVRKQHSFPGLTPGLAPVGYDPDESDEDPY